MSRHCLTVLLLLQMIESDMEQAFLAGDNTGMVSSSRQIRSSGSITTAAVAASDTGGSCTIKQQQQEQHLLQQQRKASKHVQQPCTPPHHHERYVLTVAAFCCFRCFLLLLLLLLQTATDTQKNTVYVVAKRMSKRCTIEQYAIALAQHFVHTYPRVRRGRGDGGFGLGGGVFVRVSLEWGEG